VDRDRGHHLPPGPLGSFPIQGIDPESPAQSTPAFPGQAGDTHLQRDHTVNAGLNRTGLTENAARFNASTDRGDLKRASVRGIAVTFLSQGLRFLLQFGAQIVLAHWLLPREFGVIAMVAPVLSLVQVFNDLGLTQATIQRPEITHRELSTLFWINFAISAALAAIMILASPLVAWFYHEPRLILITVAFSAMLMISGAGAQQIALMNRRMTYTPLAVIDVACAVMAFVVGLAAAYLGCGYWSLVLMQAANSLTILVLAWGLSDWRPSLPSRDSGVMALLRFGGHLTGFNILGIVETNLGTVLVGRFNGAQALGLYDRAYKLVIVPWWQISLPVARVSISLLCRLNGSDAQYARAFRQMLQGLLLVAGPGLIWASLESQTLVPLVLGSTWTRAAPIVAWLAVGTIVVPLGSSAYWLFVSQDRVKEQLHYGLLSGLLLVASILLGIIWGPIGVARAYAGFGLFIQGIQLWGATQSGPVSRMMVYRALYPVVLALSASAVALVVVHRLRGVAATPVTLAETLILAYAVAGGALLLFPAGQRIIADAYALRHALRSLRAA
jgi:PST family polysaccharide transporter